MRLSSPLARAGLCAGVLALPGPASVRGEDYLRALDRALAALEAPPGGAPQARATAAGAGVSARPPALSDAMGELERRDAVRRGEFAAAEGRRLRGRAAERLAGAKAAYDAGHGRLLVLLRDLTRPSPEVPADTARSDRLAE